MTSELKSLIKLPSATVTHDRKRTTTAVNAKFSSVFYAPLIKVKANELLRRASMLEDERDNIIPSVTRKKNRDAWAAKGCKTGSRSAICGSNGIDAAEKI